MAQTNRFDKYDPVSGGFRAPLLAAILSADVNKIQGVSINTAGKVVIGGTAETSIIGVICPVRTMAAGEIIDVMTAGEIAEARTTADAAFTAGAVVKVTGTTGAIAAGAPGAGEKAIGRAIELDRLVIRCPMATAV
jgi:hypothetical protein